MTHELPATQQARWYQGIVRQRPNASRNYSQAQSGIQSIAAIQSDALVEAAKIVHDKLSWVEGEQRFFSNIGALEAHTEIIKRATAHHNSD